MTIAKPQPVRYKTLRTLQRLAPSGVLDCIYWADGHDLAPFGQEALTNGHWLLISTPGTQQIFNNLKAKFIKSGDTQQFAEDQKSFTINRPFADANGILDTAQMGKLLSLEPADLSSLQTEAPRGLVGEARKRAVSLYGPDGHKIFFRADYLLPLLGCHYTIYLNTPTEMARLDHGGEFAGVLMPCRA